jgi:hypothetical protein
VKKVFLDGICLGKIKKYTALMKPSLVGKILY